MPSRVRFPDVEPTDVAPIVTALMDCLGPLVPEGDRTRILDAIGGMPFAQVPSVGLELTLPPHPPACDLSILLPPGEVPPFVTHPVLHRLAAQVRAQEAGSTWWELDTASGGGSGGFIRLLDGVDGLRACREAIDGEPSPEEAERLRSALDRTAALMVRGIGSPALLGLFPDRRPAAAAGLVAVASGEMTSALTTLASDATVATDPSDPRLRALLERLPTASIAIGCDALGRIGVAAETSFGDRVRAMQERRWDAAFDGIDLGAANEVLPLLLATQAVHDFRTLFGLTMLAGIDHCKVTPDGRLKAYVGALPFRRGVGVVALPPGMP